MYNPRLPKRITALSRRDLWIVLRENRGSVQTVAKRIGVTRATIHNCLSGKGYNHQKDVEGGIRQFVRELLSDQRGRAQ